MVIWDFFFIYKFLVILYIYNFDKIFSSFFYFLYGVENRFLLNVFY